jgi:hypothetical protein
MDTQITNAAALRAEIERLKGIEQQQSAALLDRINTPPALFATVTSLFPKLQGLPKAGAIKGDIVGMIARILLPLTLNKTVFRKSNFIVKALVTFTTQRLSRFISEDNVIGVVQKLTNLFSKKSKAAQVDVQVKYGALPPSEAHHMAM